MLTFFLDNFQISSWLPKFSSILGPQYDHFGIDSSIQPKSLKFSLLEDQPYSVLHDITSPEHAFEVRVSTVSLDKR